jgi:hypothetical protein
MAKSLAAGEAPSTFGRATAARAPVSLKDRASAVPSTNSRLSDLFAVKPSGTERRFGDVATPVGVDIHRRHGACRRQRIARVLLTCKFYVGVRAKADGLTETLDQEPQMLNTMFYLLAQPTLAPQFCDYRSSTGTTSDLLSRGEHSCISKLSMATSSARKARTKKSSRKTMKKL